MILKLGKKKVIRKKIEVNFLEEMIKLGKEVIPIIKTEERESSEMCEFIISGNESYVLNCLKLILTK